MVLFLFYKEVKSMKITLIDGKVIEVENGLTGLEIAAKISVSLPKKTIAVKVNDVLQDFRLKINEDCKFEVVTKESKEALDVLNHSCAHVMAQAIKHLYKDAQFAYGPSVEEGFYYDVLTSTPISEKDFPAIEKEMAKIVQSGLPIERKEIDVNEGKEIFKDQKFKLIHLEELKGTITVYSQGDFTDLCRGPHVASTALCKAFKLMSIAGAYFKGDKNKEQLTRVYGTCFFSKEDLDAYLKLLEERKESDHRKLGKELGLFMISDYGPGFPFYLPNGMMLRRQIESWWYKIHDEHNYQIIKSPIILSKELWLTSGHWDHYKENMYTTKSDDRDFAIKPMNCPGAILVYNSSLHSYKDLPLRLGELGLVHRHEASGALNGLFRVRCFTQDDAHIFCTKEQLKGEIESLLKLYDEMYSTFKLDYYIVLSTKPEKDYIGDDEIWEKSEEILASACKATGKEFKINPGDGAFYGPKLDFKLKDCMGRVWQCGTIQLDMNLPQRFNCTYIDKDGTKKQPIMLHRAMLGSIERFIGVITENFAGAFPTWCTPVQIKILPVNNQFHLEYSKKLYDQFKANKLRVELDDSEEKLAYRIRNAQIMKIPYSLVIGDKEVQNGTVTYRKYGSEKQVTVSVDEFLKLINEEIESKALLVDPEKSIL